VRVVRRQGADCPAFASSGVDLDVRPPACQPCREDPGISARRLAPLLEDLIHEIADVAAGEHPVAEVVEQA
jgi:hypothetical protein